MTQVTAIVVVFNSAPDRLHRCLTALRASQEVDVQIVLVDNDSAPPAHHDLADLIIHRGDNGGFAVGVNEGVRVATGEFIAVVNDDAMVAPTMLQKCVHALTATSDPMVVAAAPKVLFSGTDQPHLDSCGIVVRRTGEAFSAGAGQPDIGQFDHDTTVLGPCMSAAVFRRDAFERVGMLDERYFLYYEDVDWALRAFLSGHHTLFVPDAIAHHDHAASTRTLGEARRHRMVLRNLLWCATVNLSARSVATVWATRVVAAAKAAVKGPDRTTQLRALGAALRGTPSALVTRRRRRAAACVPDADAFAYADGLTPFVDVATYRPSQPADALRAAEARRARAQVAR